MTPVPVINTLEAKSVGEVEIAINIDVMREIVFVGVTDQVPIGLRIAQAYALYKRLGEAINQLLDSKQQQNRLPKQ